MTNIRWKSILTAIFCISVISGSHGQNSYDYDRHAPLSYIAHKTNVLIDIDGLDNDKAWEKASWSSYFIDIEGDKKPKFNTRFKMLWDDNYLYVYSELEEPHIWAKITEHDQVVYYDNDFEIFIDPDGDTHNYFEIEVNALETVFDLFMNKPYRNGGLALIPWDSKGLKISVDIDGTINDPSDIDRKWSVEMAIPFKSISHGNHIQVPGDGEIWRINFSRVQWQVDVRENEYNKAINPVTDRPFNEDNWVWSPQGIINMHYPEKWGYVQFSTDQQQGEDTDFVFPEKEDLKNQLWRIYHLQKEYHHQNGAYAKNLEILKIDKEYRFHKHTCLTEMESTSHQFLATIYCETSKEIWSIDHDGCISKNSVSKNQ